MRRGNLLPTTIGAVFTIIDAGLDRDAVSLTRKVTLKWALAEISQWERTGSLVLINSLDVFQSGF